MRPRVIFKGTSEEHVKQKKDDVPKVNSTPGKGGGGGGCAAVKGMVFKQFTLG